jgi:hypothetical protein
VRGECEDKYGPVVGIKVERETQVGCNLYLAGTRANPFCRRARYTSSLIQSNPPRKPSRVLTVAFSAGAAFLLHSSPTRCSRLISDRQRSTLFSTECSLCQKTEYFSRMLAAADFLSLAVLISERDVVLCRF